MPADQSTAQMVPPALAADRPACCPPSPHPPLRPLPPLQFKYIVGYPIKPAYDRLNLIIQAYIDGFPNFQWQEFVMGMILICLQVWVRCAVMRYAVLAGVVALVVVQAGGEGAPCCVLCCTHTCGWCPREVGRASSSTRTG